MMHSVRQTALAFGCFLALPLGVGCKHDDAKHEVVVAAAASMRVALPDIAKAYAEERGVKITATYGASGDLRRQVEAGAPVDAVVFASAAPVNDLVSAGLVDKATERVIARNELVLIGPKGGPPLSFMTIDTAPSTEHIAIGDPAAVPAGTYARDALKRLGKWRRSSRSWCSRRTCRRFSRTCAVVKWLLGLSIEPKRQARPTSWYSMKRRATGRRARRSLRVW